MSLWRGSCQVCSAVSGVLASHCQVPAKCGQLPTEEAGWNLLLAGGERINSAPNLAIQDLLGERQRSLFSNILEHFPTPTLSTHPSVARATSANRSLELCECREGSGPRKDLRIGVVRRVWPLAQSCCGTCSASRSHTPFVTFRVKLGTSAGCGSLGEGTTRLICYSWVQVLARGRNAVWECRGHPTHLPLHTSHSTPKSSKTVGTFPRHNFQSFLSQPTGHPWS